jgi:hypothetical protein
MKNHVVMFTSGAERRDDAALQCASVYRAAEEASGSVPAPLVRTASRDAIVLSIVADTDAAMLLSAIKRRLPAQAFDFSNAHGTADCIIVLTLSDSAVLGGAGVTGIAR